MTPRAIPPSLLCNTGLVLLLGLAGAARTQAQSYDARAFAAQVGHVMFTDTGQLEPSGGVISKSEGSIRAEFLSTGKTNADCLGMRGVARSSASARAVVVTRLRVELLSATLVSAASEARCTGTSGSTRAVGLVFGGARVRVNGQANQRVQVPGVGTLIVNERTVQSLSITVNALHLILETGEELIVCGSRSRFGCPTAIESETWSGIKDLYR